MSQWDRMDSALVHAEGLFYSERGLFFIESPDRASHVGSYVFRRGLKQDVEILGQERLFVLHDFLAHVQLVGKHDPMIPETSTLHQLREHMEVRSMVYISVKDDIGPGYGQKRFILIAVATTCARGRLMQDFLTQTTIWIPGQPVFSSLMVEGKFLARPQRTSGSSRRARKAIS